MLTPASPRHLRGFTLIELLMVIAVIGILAAILIVGFGQVRSRANLTESLAELRQIGLAYSLYAQENNGYAPTPSNMVDQDNPDRTHWAMLIARRNEYLGQSGQWIHEVLVAPNAGYADPAGGMRDDEEVFLTYSAAGTSSKVTPGGFLDFKEARLMSNVENPSDAVLVFLARQRAAQDGYCGTVHPNFNRIKGDLEAAGAEATKVLNFAYNGSMPMVMADGSARALKFEDRDFLTQERWEGRFMKNNP